MNIKIINPSVLTSLTSSLILLSVFSSAGRAQATPTGTTTLSGYVDTAANYTTADKGGYKLWIMTPPELRRPFVSDFGADSPITLDAGAFAADVGFGYNLREQTRNGVRRTLESWDLGYSTLKLGLFNNADFEVGIPTWRVNDLTLKDKTGEDSRWRSGFGNLTTRIKYNLFGNDAIAPACTPDSCCWNGVSALSVSADMIWPTASCGYSIRDSFGFRQIDTFPRQIDTFPFFPTLSDTNNPTRDTGNTRNRRDRKGNSPDYRGGLSLQYSYSCGCGMQVRINSGFILSESDRGCWNSCFDNRISVSKTIFDRAAVLVAFDTTVSTERRSEWQGQIQAAATYQFTPNLQGEIGSGFGVTRRANDFSPFVHMAYRY